MYLGFHSNSHILTKSVPRTVWEFASRILLHEKHSLSSHNLPYSWELHLFSGAWMEFAVSPEVNSMHLVEMVRKWGKHAYRLLPIGYAYPTI